MTDQEKARVAGLRECISEAERFISKARIALGQVSRGDESLHYSPSIAAAKRASLDLTKQLANLRQFGTVQGTAHGGEIIR